MNNDETNPEAIDPALEARVVAWVLGEASPFEVAELERKIAEDPRLEIFKRRIEAVHGLLGEATAPVHAPQRLAEDRRAKLLAALGAGEAVSVTEKALPVVAVGSRRMGWWRQWGIPMAASAALLIGGFSFLCVEFGAVVRFSGLRSEIAGVFDQPRKCWRWRKSRTTGRSHSAFLRQTAWREDTPNGNPSSLRRDRPRP